MSDWYAILVPDFVWAPAVIVVSMVQLHVAGAIGGVVAVAPAANNAVAKTFIDARRKGMSQMLRGEFVSLKNVL